MNDDLSQELLMLERRLQARVAGPASEELAGRIMRSVRAELSRPAPTACGRWGFVGAAAAALLIGANLALVATSNGRFESAGHGRQASVQLTSDTVRQLSTVVPENEIRQTIVLLGLSQDLPRVPGTRSPLIRQIDLAEISNSIQAPQLNADELK